MQILESAKEHLLKVDVLWQAGNRQLKCTLKTEYQYGGILDYLPLWQYKIPLGDSKSDTSGKATR